MLRAVYGKKKESPWNLRETGDLQYIDQNILKESKAKQKNIVVAWTTKKSQWFGPANLDYRMSENVQNIRRSHKIHLKSRERLGSGIKNRKKNFNVSESSERHLPGRYAVDLTVCYNNDATQ